MPDNLITLRSPAQEDSENYFKWINDRELVLLNGNYKPVLKKDHEQWFMRTMLNDENKTFSIIANKDNKLIGTCSLRNINPAHKNAELQIRIGDRNYHGRGYGSEAVSKLVDFGFHQLHLKRIYLHVFCHNVRAIKAYQKTNFQIEGIQKKAALINNEFVDVVLMARINENNLF